MGIYLFMGLGRAIGAATCAVDYLEKAFSTIKEGGATDETFHLFHGISRDAKGTYSEHYDPLSYSNRNNIEAIIIFTSREVINETLRAFPYTGSSNPGSVRRELKKILRDVWKHFNPRTGRKIYWCEVDIDSFQDCFNKVTQVARLVKSTSSMGKEIWCNLTGGSQSIGFALLSMARLTGWSTKQYLISQDKGYRNEVVIPIPKENIRPNKDGYLTIIPFLKTVIDIEFYEILTLLDDLKKPVNTDELFGRLKNRQLFINLSFENFKRHYMMTLSKLGYIRHDLQSDLNSITGLGQHFVDENLDTFLKLDDNFDVERIDTIENIAEKWTWFSTETLDDGSDNTEDLKIAFHLTSIELKNIRCFGNISFSLTKEGKPISWTTIIGNNATGKTTLLRAIALGLCNESDTISLMRKIPGSFIRKGEKEGTIIVTLQEEKSKNTYRIVTALTKPSEEEPEIVRKQTMPKKNFPWDDIFICAYGTQRFKQTHASYSKYESINAVQGLFDYNSSLQNPEVILLRQQDRMREILEKKLLRILMLDDSDYKINYSESGIEIQGPWGTFPFEVLSDGYRGTMQWILDFIGWSIYADKFWGDEDIGGILLIDELEQHLHPKWQRYITQRIRKQFPKVQIITTTHTPLAASGVVDIEMSMLLKLYEYQRNSVAVQVIEKDKLKGKRADQVLASEAFDLVTTRSPGSEDKLSRYTELLTKKNLTKQEIYEQQQLNKLLKDSLLFGENEFEQLVERAVSEVLNKLLNEEPSEVFKFETKRQLRELFRPKG